MLTGQERVGPNNQDGVEPREHTKWPEGHPPTRKTPGRQESAEKSIGGQAVSRMPTSEADADL